MTEIKLWDLFSQWWRHRNHQNFQFATEPTHCSLLATVIFIFSFGKFHKFSCCRHFVHLYSGPDICASRRVCMFLCYIGRRKPELFVIVSSKWDSVMSPGEPLILPQDISGPFYSVKTAWPMHSALAGGPFILPHNLLLPFVPSWRRVLPRFLVWVAGLWSSMSKSAAAIWICLLCRLFSVFQSLVRYCFRILFLINLTLRDFGQRYTKIIFHSAFRLCYPQTHRGIGLLEVCSVAFLIDHFSSSPSPSVVRNNRRWWE